MTIRARGGKALVLAVTVGVGAGLGTWAVMLVGVPAWIAGAIGGAIGYGAAWLVARGLERREAHEHERDTPQ